MCVSSVVFAKATTCFLGLAYLSEAMVVHRLAPDIRELLASTRRNSKRAPAKLIHSEIALRGDLQKKYVPSVYEQIPSIWCMFAITLYASLQKHNGVAGYNFAFTCFAQSV